ncbi:MAG: hypothetical protein KF752_16910 [Pirellulaceae bacterium]|nr:hypothetical protein [Pirellulaceae bacterium]
MKLTSLLALLLVGMAVTNAAAQGTSKKIDPSGTWRFEYDLQGQIVEDSLRLQLGKEGALTGTYKGRSDEPVEIAGGKIDGEQIVVDMEIEVQGLAIKVKFDGKIKDDSIDGVVIATTPEGDMEFDWVAKRSVQAEDVVGLWELEIDAGDTVLEPTVEIKLDGTELKGLYKDADTGLESELKEVKIEDNVLKFSISGEFQGNEIKAAFSGRPYGSKLSGSVEYDLSGQTGEIGFEGQLTTPKKAAEPAPAAQPAEPAK